MKFPRFLLAWFTSADEFVQHEDKDFKQMITDAINNLAAAINGMVNERASDRAAVAQAQSDRDAAQASLATANQQLSDAETQIVALTAQIAPPQE